MPGNNGNGNGNGGDDDPPTPKPDVLTSAEKAVLCADIIAAIPGCPKTCVADRCGDYHSKVDVAALNLRNTAIATAQTLLTTV